MRKPRGLRLIWVTCVLAVVSVVAVLLREILNGPTGHFISDETAATAAGDLAEEFFQ